MAFLPIIYLHRVDIFIILVLLGLVFETAAYVCRNLLNTGDWYGTVCLTIGRVIVMMGPVFFSATIYKVLSILIGEFRRDCRPILRLQSLLAFLVALDAISTLVQIAGVGLKFVNRGRATETLSSASHNLVLVGLMTQLFSSITFLAFSYNTASRAHFSVRAQLKFIILAYFVSTLSTLLSQLNTFSVLSLGGLSGKLRINECYIGRLRLVPATFAIITLALFHSSRWIPRRLLLSLQFPLYHQKRKAISSRVSTVSEWVAEPPIRREKVAKRMPRPEPIRNPRT